MSDPRSERLLALAAEARELIGTWAAEAPPVREAFPRDMLRYDVLTALQRIELAASRMGRRAMVKDEGGTWSPA